MDFSHGFEFGEPDGQLETAFGTLSTEQSLEKARKDGSVEDLSRLNAIRVRYAESAAVFYECYLLDQTLQELLPEQKRQQIVTPETVRDYFEGPAYRSAKRRAGTSPREETDFLETEKNAMVDLIRAMLIDGRVDSAVGTFVAASEGIDGQAVSRQSGNRVLFAQRIVAELDPASIAEATIFDFTEEALGLLQRYGDGKLSGTTLDARHALGTDLVEYGSRANASPAFFERVLYDWEVASINRQAPLPSFLTHVRDRVHAATPDTAETTLGLIHLIPGRADYQALRQEMIDTLSVVLRSREIAGQQNPA